MTSQRMPSMVRVWILAIRPKTLPAALGPVMVGTALAVADGKFAFSPALAAVTGALLLQIGVNLANFKWIGEGTVKAGGIGGAGRLPS